MILIATVIPLLQMNREMRRHKDRRRRYIGMQRCRGRRMRSVRQRSASWKKKKRANEEEAAVLKFDKWKGEFSVDAQGTTEELHAGNQDMFYEFVEYIKKQKCVPVLEDLAI